MKMKSVLFSCSLFLVVGLAATARSIAKESLHPKLLLPNTQHIDTVGRDAVFTKVDVEASFKGGTDAWIRFVQKNLKGEVPVNNGAPAGHHTVVVQFIVDGEGNISDIQALTRQGYGMEEEVMRVIRLSPVWEPAKKDNQTVKAYRKQPITFVVEEKTKKRRFL
jgi:protein TonB